MNNNFQTLVPDAKMNYYQNNKFGFDEKIIPDDAR